MMKDATQVHSTVKIYCSSADGANMDEKWGKKHEEEVFKKIM